MSIRSTRPNELFVKFFAARTLGTSVFHLVRCTESRVVACDTSTKVKSLLECSTLTNTIIFTQCKEVWVVASALTLPGLCLFTVDTRTIAATTDFMYSIDSSGALESFGTRIVRKITSSADESFGQYWCLARFPRW